MFKTDLREDEFIDYLIRLLRSNSNFSEVQVVIPPEISLDLEPQLTTRIRTTNILAKQIKNNNWSKVYIECTSQIGFSSSRIKDILNKLKIYLFRLKGERVAFAFPGTLPEKIIEDFRASGIEVWDVQFLSQHFKDQIHDVEHPFFQSILLDALKEKQPSPEEILIQELRTCQPGTEDWPKYQKIVGKILERLFCPTFIYSYLRTFGYRKK
jgi:hypothetical protein